MIDSHREVTREDQERFATHGFASLGTWFTSSSHFDRLRSLSDQMSSRAAAILYRARASGNSLASIAREEREELIVVAESTDVGKICRYEFMLGNSPAFRSFVDAHVVPVVEKLIGQPVLPFKDKTNEKLPGGGAFGPHQDIVAYRSFGAHYYVTAMIAVDQATVLNGCLQVAGNLHEVVSSHPEAVCDSVGSGKILHINVGGSNYGDIRKDVGMLLRWQPIICDPGGLVVFDAFVPHFSMPNLSLTSRRAIFLTFIPASGGDLYHQYYRDKRNNYDDPKFHMSTPTISRLARLSGDID